MFKNNSEQRKYIEENFLEVTDVRKDNSHWDIYCDSCKIVRGFQVVKKYVSGQSTVYGFTEDVYAAKTIYFKCPVCSCYKLWLVFELQYEKRNKAGTYFIDKIYRVTSVPNEGIENIPELPTKPAALREAYRQAIRSMDANAYIAAAAMFRRAVQVITRNILNISPSSLDKELKDSVGRSYNGITLTNDFKNVGYIIKEAGNQGAHPDEDPDLLDFTAEDAKDLQKIFMELVSDLFIIPEAIKKTREDFMARRKINIPKSS